MDPAAPRPSGYSITAETTGLHLEPLPPGYRPSELVLRLAVTETHEWFGIGGGSGRLRRPRRLSRDRTISLSPANSGGPDYLRSAADCRRLIVLATMDAFRDEGDHLRRVSPADWDEAVPRGAEARIAERARAMPGAGAAGGAGACRCEVSIRVRVEFVYSEAAALLWACTEATGDGLASRRRASGPCSICLEEMAAPDAAEATRLPGCGHGFHRRCIGGWFDKASTCPVCRRDKLRYLPPDYRAARDMILSDPEGSC